MKCGKHGKSGLPRSKKATPHCPRSWVTAAGAVLNMPRDARAALCIRARAEFDAAYDQLARQGIQVRADREQCWRDFAGWRVNYDTVLLQLADLTMAPEAP